MVFNCNEENLLDIKDYIYRNVDIEGIDLHFHKKVEKDKKV